MLQDSSDGIYRSYTYDNFGRLVSETLEVPAVGGGLESYTTTTHFNGLGQVTDLDNATVVGAPHTTTSLNYHAEGWATLMADATSGEVYWSQGSVNAAGQPLLSQWNNDLLWVTQIYDDRHRLKQQTVTGPANGLLGGVNTTFSNVQYTYDEQHLRTRDDLHNGWRDEYTYDHKGQLLEAQLYHTQGPSVLPVRVQSFTYDRLGNVLTETDSDPSVGQRTYVYGPDETLSEVQTVGTGEVQSLLYTLWKAASFVEDELAQVTYNVLGTYSELQDATGSPVTVLRGPRGEKVVSLSAGFAGTRTVYLPDGGELQFRAVEGGTQVRERHRHGLATVERIHHPGGVLIQRTSYYSLRDQLGGPTTVLEGATHGEVATHVVGPRGDRRNPADRAFGIEAGDQDFFAEVMNEGFASHEAPVAGTSVSDHGLRLYLPGLGRYLAPDPLPMQTYLTGSGFQYTGSNYTERVDLTGAAFGEAQGGEAGFIRDVVVHEPGTELAIPDWSPEDLQEVYDRAYAEYMENLAQAEQRQQARGNAMYRLYPETLHSYPLYEVDNSMLERERTMRRYRSFVVFGQSDYMMKTVSLMTVGDISADSSDDMIRQILAELEEGDIIQELSITDHPVLVAIPGKTRSVPLGGADAVLAQAVGFDDEVGMGDLLTTKHLKQLEEYTKPGTTVIELQGCNMGRSEEVLKMYSRALNGVEVVAGTSYQHLLIPGIEGSVVRCKGDTCTSSAKTIADTWNRTVMEPMIKHLKMRPRLFYED